MQYIFRVNVRGQDYTLYSYTREEGLREHHLDVASRGLPPNFLNAQSHIDGLIDQDSSRPYLWVSSGEVSSLAVYGCRFDAVEQYDRPGITLICGLHDDRNKAIDLVHRIIRLVLPEAMTEVGGLVSRIAIGQADPTALVSLFDRIVPRALPWNPASGSGFGGSPVGAVVHDSGGVALAWQAMTIAHSRATEPWAVYDDIDRTDNRTIVTRSSKDHHGQRILLSDYVRFAAYAVQPPVPISGAPPEAVIPQPPTPRWTRPVVWAVGAAMSVLANVVLVFMLVLTGGSDLGYRTQPSRVIAQYDYRFDLPNGWAQTGGKLDQLSTEIKPTGGQAADRITITEPRHDAVADSPPSPPSLGQTSKREDPASQATTFAGRDVMFQHEKSGKSVIDRYSLFEGDVRIEVACEHTQDNDSVRSACETVIGSLVIYS